MERTVTTGQKASRLHRGGSNAGAKEGYPQAISPAYCQQWQQAMNRSKEATNRIKWSLLENT